MELRKGLRRLARLSLLPLVALVVASHVVIPQSVRADLPNTNGADTAPNFAEITVLEDRVRVALEIDFPDYPAFVPGGMPALTSEAEPKADALSDQTGTAFAVLGPDGVALEPVVAKIDVRNRTPRLVSASAPRLASGPAPPKRGERVIYVALDYLFEGKPGELTFVPPLSAQMRASVGLGVIARHGKVPVTDYRFLSQAEKVRLDWDDPWFTTFHNPNLSRHHKSPIMSFVTIDPREVRQEVLFRLQDLAGWTDLDLNASTAFDESDVETITKKAERYFETLEPPLIDGKRIAPTSIQVLFLDVGAEGVTPILNPDAIDPETALMGAILSYPHKRLPEALTLTWQLFTDQAQKIPVRVRDPAGPVPASVTVDSPTVKWRNFLKTWVDKDVSPVRISAGPTLSLPVLSLALLALALSVLVAAIGSTRWRSFFVIAAAFLSAGALFAWPYFVIAIPLKGMPGEETAKAVSEAILTNAATAALETESASFDAALSGFVPLEKVRPVGAGIRSGLSGTLPSGGRALTDAINDLTIEIVESRPNGFVVLARWTALMSGGHWGHEHRRQVSQSALLNLKETDDVWMLQDLIILSSKIKE